MKKKLFVKHRSLFHRKVYTNVPLTYRILFHWVECEYPAVNLVIQAQESHGAS